MAKSQRSSVTKANNQRLKKNVFGPVEAARQQRLSARLLEIASQPRPVPEKDMKDAAEQGITKAVDKSKQAGTAMEVDEPSKTKPKAKGKIVKRRGRKSNIVFPKFGERRNKKR
ncbi:hypothetical protein DHEL01_v203683 [Diaporthe helianthi]|uniref:DUF2423 domain-containing protein n=1 Tax=Diaporthe helianthi TaxID=158607 RepID=A0A2P5I5Z0_DIAHE|nr:hypothetical protein DHEL01_v203683 [Diaporthe helianthi]